MLGGAVILPSLVVEVQDTVSHTAPVGAGTAVTGIGLRLVSCAHKTHYVLRLDWK